MSNMHFNVYVLGPCSQSQFDKILRQISEYDELLTRKYGEDLTYDVVSFHQIKPSEALYNTIAKWAQKDGIPDVVILHERSWSRYGGALGWATCDMATATVYTFRWLPAWWIDTHVIRHEWAHTILCRLGREWIRAVHDDPEVA